MGRKSLLFVVLSLAAILALGAGAFAAIASRGSSSVPTGASLSRVSAAGDPVGLPAGRAREDLERSGFGSIYLLGSYGGRNLFLLRRSDGTGCYGSGRIDSAWPIGRYICESGPTPFPSPARPILDFSLAVQNTGDSTMHFEQVEGVAADGVAAIHVVGLDGHVIRRIPVEGNFYSSGSADLGNSAVRIEAVDDGGRVLAVVPR